LVGPTLLFVMNIGILLIIWFGSFEVNQNGLLVGELVTLINYGFRITAALGMLTWITMAFARGRASAQRISEVLNTEEDFENNNIPSTTSKIRYGKVDFENVSFTYPGTNTPVLQDISFTVEAGDRVAVMGATGSGKSTLFQLIPRLYDTTKGCIRIDGIDIKKMDLKTLRKQMGFVPQEAILFTGSVKENISWGKDDATIEEIIESMEDAQIYETIKRLPNTYETKIGQKGVNFSGGQKQRLSIARALIRKPKLLFLDDSTSALDMRTEAKLLQALDKFDCTTFIITQKITTAKAADQILLLDEGRLVANGSHDSLLATSELYKAIYQSQNAKEVL